MSLAKLPSWIAIAALFIAPAAFATDFDLTWHTIDGGGGYSAGGGFELEGTIGQHDAGYMSGGEFSLLGGFWGNVSTSIPIPGDCDADGDIDLDDYLQFELCLFGPMDGLDAGCECFDFDADNDTDLLDFAELQVNFTGSE